MPGAPSEASLRALGQSLAEREGCADTCCLGEVPRWLLGADLHRADSEHAAALRGILDTTRDARVRALALRWLAQALDVGDVERMARSAGSAEPAGSFPEVFVSQQVAQCYPVQWAPATLGEVTLGALSTITGESFQGVDAFQQWRRDNPDPARSVRYWERFLGRGWPAAPERLAALRGVDQELYAVVILSAPEGRGYGLDEAEIVRAARGILGQERLLRILAGEEGKPELSPSASKGRLARFAASVLRRAEAIFEPGHGPALVRLWDQGALKEMGSVRAELAVAAGRLHPAERCRVLEEALGELSYGHAVVLEDLARRCAGDRAALLREWFYSPATRSGDAQANAAAILRGLAGAGAAARPALRALVRKEQPLAEEANVTEALMDAAVAAGCADAFPRRKGIRPPVGKGMYGGDDGERRLRAAEAEAEAARSDCVKRALACIAGP